MAIHLDRIGKQALQLVSRETPTASLSTSSFNSPEREVLQRSTASAVIKVLGQYDWTFATKQAILSQKMIYTKDEKKVAANPEKYTNQYFGWHNKFSLPADYVSHLKIFSPDWSETINYTCGQREWRIINKDICTLSDYEKTGLNIEYTYYSTESINLPADVEMSIVYYLAHLIAPSLIGSFEASERFYMLYKRQLLEAKENDVRGRVPPLRRYSTML